MVNLLPMKKSIITFKNSCCLLVLALLILGCGKEWAHYYSMNGQFSIDTPEAPIEVVKFANMVIGPVTVNSSSYTTSDNQLAYAVNYYDLAENILTKTNEEILALAARSFINFSGKNINVLSKKDIFFDGIKGIELELESRGGSRLVVGKIFYTRGKVYYVVVEKIGDKNITEDDIKFLDSFKFHFSD